jgi:hypothetical protein
MNLWSRTLLPVPGRVLKPGWFSEQYKTRWKLRQEFKSCLLYPSPLGLLPKQIFSPHWGLPFQGPLQINWEILIFRSSKSSPDIRPSARRQELCLLSWGAGLRLGLFLQVEDNGRHPPDERQKEQRPRGNKIQGPHAEPVCNGTTNGQR